MYEVKIKWKGRTWVDTFKTKAQAQKYANMNRKDIRQTIKYEKKLSKRYPKGTIPVSKYSIRIKKVK